MRYLIGSDTVLLPFCPSCKLASSRRWRATMDLALQVRDDAGAWVDPAPLRSYRCSVAGCARVWHHLGGPLPYRATTDPHPRARDRRWHPCPWCVRDDPDAATAAHRARARQVATLHRWERDLDLSGS